MQIFGRRSESILADNVTGGRLAKEIHAQNMVLPSTCFQAIKKGFQGILYGRLQSANTRLGEKPLHCRTTPTM